MIFGWNFTQWSFNTSIWRLCSRIASETYQFGGRLIFSFCGGARLKFGRKPLFWVFALDVHDIEVCDFSPPRIVSNRSFNLSQNIGCAPARSQNIPSGHYNRKYPEQSQSWVLAGRNTDLRSEGLWLGLAISSTSLANPHHRPSAYGHHWAARSKIPHLGASLRTWFCFPDILRTRLSSQK